MFDVAFKFIKLSIGILTKEFSLSVFDSVLYFLVSQ